MGFPKIDVRMWVSLEYQPSKWSTLSLFLLSWDFLWIFNKGSWSIHQPSSNGSCDFFTILGLLTMVVETSIIVRVLESSCFGVQFVAGSCREFGVKTRLISRLSWSWNLSSWSFDLGTASLNMGKNLKYSILALRLKALAWISLSSNRASSSWAEANKFQICSP